MRHHILIPTDFSDNARSAAEYAIRLYRDKPCTFYFLHVWTYTNTGGRTYISSNYIDVLKNNAEKQLAEVKEQAEDDIIGRDHLFESIFTTDPFIDSITDAIKTKNINLLVMGTKGATGAQEFLFGSNAVTVISRVKLCPILLIPKGYEFKTPKTIGYPTDFIRPYGPELVPIRDLVSLHDSTINILHINNKDGLSETQRNNFNILQDYLKDISHTFYWKSDYTRKELAIKDFIDENAIDILTMIHYKHGFIEDLIKEPVIKKLGYHSDIPFMVIPHS